MVELCCEYFYVRDILLSAHIMSGTRVLSEFTLYNCLNVKELLAGSRREI